MNDERIKLVEITDPDNDWISFMGFAREHYPDIPFIEEKYITKETILDSPANDD